MARVSTHTPPPKSAIWKVCCLAVQHSWRQSIIQVRHISWSKRQRPGQTGVWLWKAAENQLGLALELTNPVHRQEFPELRTKRWGFITLAATGLVLKDQLTEATPDQESSDL